MTSFPHHIFRKYDIRGIYGQELTEEVVYRTARAFGTLCRERSGKGRPVVAVGLDARLHSPSVRGAFAEGLVSVRCDWIDIGLCPTPLVYFSAFKLPVDAFAMVTASHNPPGDNGLKLGIGRETIHSGDITGLGGRAALDKAPYTATGAVPLRRVDIVGLYRAFALDHFKEMAAALQATAISISVVVDSGNGTAGVVLPDILRGLGFTVHEMFSEPDGTFPNHHPDPTLPEALEALKAEVGRTGAHLGLSFDGDADRLGVLDERGRIIWGDMLLLILGREILRKWKEEGGKGEPPLVISEVKASEVLYDGIREAGGRVQMWKTGHALIKARMKETGASVAGEMSGHLFFADRYFGYDDALYGALRLLEVYLHALQEGKCQRFSDLLKGLPETVTTPEIRFPCPETRKFPLVEKFADLLTRHRDEGREPLVRDILFIDGVRARFEKGWGLLRASNTQPVLVMRFEGPTGEEVEKYGDFFDRLLKEAGTDLEVTAEAGNRRMEKGE